MFLLFIENKLPGHTERQETDEKYARRREIGEN